MADPAIVTRDEPLPLPGGYELPGTFDLDVSAISASFDGSGAAGSFLACASVYSQSGHLIGRYFPSQVFAAGDTGEVSYGPFLEQAAGAAPAAGFTPDVAIAFGSNTVTANNNILTTINFQNTSTPTGSTAWQNNAGGTQPFTLRKDGWVLLMLDFDWLSGAPFTDVRYYGVATHFGADNLGGSPNDPYSSESSPFTTGFRGCWGPLYYRSFSTSQWFEAQVRQASGAGKDILTCELTALYLGPDLQPARFPI